MRETGVSDNKSESSFSLRAAALIFKQNKLLVAKSVDYPCYYTVGGAVELNESSKEAVIREVFEETGFTMEIDRLAFVQERFLPVEGKKLHEVVFFYIMKTGGEFTIAENSFTDQPLKETLHWLPLDELYKYNLVPEFLKTKSFDNISGIEHIISKEY